MEKILFSIPYTVPESAANIQSLISGNEKVADLGYTNKCNRWFEERFEGYHAYLTTTGTHAIEIAARSLDLQPGDEVILPSFNYVGVANAFLNAGASLVFVDIDPVTMNVSTDRILEAVGPKTKVISAMHYGGVPCGIDKLRKVCTERNLVLFEDNAHGIGATGPNGILGSYGDLSCISFDRLKNVSVHQGGLLLCREPFVNAVDIAFDNGTNRQAFFKGKISSYSWVGRGSNYAMSEYLSAALLPLLEASDEINCMRRERWDLYYNKISRHDGLVRLLPVGLNECSHNGHIFYLKAKDKEERKAILGKLRGEGIEASFHYVPLHSSEAGLQFSRFHGADRHTTTESERLFRLPIHNELTESQIDRVVHTLLKNIS